jgi:hypothetical protein
MEVHSGISRFISVLDTTLNDIYSLSRVCSPYGRIGRLAVITMMLLSDGNPVKASGCLNHRSSATSKVGLYQAVLENTVTGLRPSS